METFPEQIAMVVAAGHEIGIHGYSHENPIAMTRVQEEAILDKCIELAQKPDRPPPDGIRRAVVGIQSRHQRAPARARLQVRPQPDASGLPTALRPRGGPVDEDRLRKHPSAWMKPLVRGEETDLIEIPASWYLDDLPP